MAKRKRQQTEQEFTDKFDSRLGAGRASKAEGAPAMGALNRDRHQEFKNLMTGKTQTVSSWEAEMRKNKSDRRKKTGVWNPAKGVREY